MNVIIKMNIHCKESEKLEMQIADIDRMQTATENKQCKCDQVRWQWRRSIRTKRLNENNFANSFDTFTYDNFRQIVDEFAIV